MELTLALIAALAMPSLALPAALLQPTDTISETAIVGGELAVPGEFPFIVSLSVVGRSHFCGGTLLGPDTVLTAAHCSEGMNASDVRKRNAGGKVVEVSRITVHPDFVSDTLDNDFAIWRLSTRVLTGSNISYATLPAQDSDPVAGSPATVAGWGFTRENGTSPVDLMKVSVPIVSRQTCRDQYGASNITDSMVCAGLKEGGKDACQGDSGGPLIDDTSGALVGVVSWGEGCARPDFSGVYGRRFGAVPPLITDCDLSIDDKYLHVLCWASGELKQFDVTDPGRPVEMGSIRLGGVAKHTPHPSEPDVPCPGGPQMMEISRGGRRVYFTSSLYSSWDDQLYPGEVGDWMVKLNVDIEKGGMTIDKDFFPHGEQFNGLRLHQIRLQGGDASTDSYCYRAPQR
ncbi:hypothetical protein ACJZ2D_003768 [Fusarium nematophilum]